MHRMLVVLVGAQSTNMWGIPSIPDQKKILFWNGGFWLSIKEYIIYCAKISINWVKDETKAHLQCGVVMNYGRIYICI